MSWRNPVRYMLFLSFFLMIAALMPGGKPAEAFGECSEYGTAAIYNSWSNTCSCMSGYIMDTNFLGQPYCVSQSSYCYDNYGYNSTWDYFGGGCKCSSGYTWGTDFLGNSTCVSMDSVCKEDLGYSSSYNSATDSCECSYGYVISNGTCTSGDYVCHAQHGFNSDYDILSNRCECDSGYTFDESGQCVEKQNNVYFSLTELDTNGRQAIVKSEYDYNYYLISYGLGCLDYAFEQYIGDRIVVNLGTDFYLESWDKIVLQNHSQTCNLTHVERVTSDTTLEEEEEIIYYTPAPVVAPTPPPQVLGQFDESKSDPALAKRLSGSILLQTESHGEAWYVNPKNQLRYYMANGAVAYTMMRSFSLGITNSDLAKIPPVSTTAEMDSSTSVCASNSLASRLRGYILLQVEERGEAWYIDPEKCRRIYMADGEAAYQLMRYLSLGISNSDLEKLPSGVIE